MLYCIDVLNLLSGTMNFKFGTANYVNFSMRRVQTEINKLPIENKTALKNQHLFYTLHMLAKRFSSLFVVVTVFVNRQFSCTHCNVIDCMNNAGIGDTFVF
jgi:hypothetical protein